jgi:hypothetical protein
MAREGGARSGETPAKQVVAAIRALDVTQLSEHEGVGGGGPAQGPTG